MPASSSALLFTVITWPPRGMNTGLFGDTWSSSKRVGMRPSSRMLSCQPDEAVTHCPGGVCATRAAICLLHVGDRARGQELDRRRIQRREHLVQVRVDQSRHHGAAAELDDLRPRAGERRDGGIVAHRDEASVANGDCLRDTPGAVDGDDPAAAQDQVGGLGRGAGRECQCAGEHDRGETKCGMVMHGCPHYIRRGSPPCRNAAPIAGAGMPPAPRRTQRPCR